MLTSSKLYAKKFSFHKNSSMKQTTYQKLRNSNKNTFSFISHVCYFSYHPSTAASEDRSLTIQEHQHPYPILLEFRHSSSPLCKNDKKREVDKKIQACETLRLVESFVGSSCRCSKQSVSRLLTRQNTLLGGLSFKFVVETIIHHCYCMLVKSFI